MAISGQANINIGLPNESTGSDSLYAAFTKIQDNFNVLFTNGSPYNNFVAGNGVSISSNANTGNVTVTNTGVLNLTAGTGVTLSAANGNVTISANAGGNGGAGTVTSVGVVPISASRIVIAGSPIVSSGNISVDLATTGVTPATYTNPTVGVDAYGRITSISNNTIAGTVTSVGITPGNGIQVAGGPVTSAGNITITNTGVTRLTAGSGISLSASNGNVTVSATTLGGTVTSVGVTSSQLVVTGSPITTVGSIGINLPSNATFSGNVTAGGIKTDNLYYANGNPWDLELPAGGNTQLQFNNNGSFGASANLTYNNSTNLLTVTGNLSVTGNSNVGNLGTTGLITATGNVTGGNLVTSGLLNVTGNANVGNIGATNANVSALTATGNIEAGNLVIAAGNIFYTPRYGAFYSNADQTNPIANTAMAMTFNNTVTANGISVVGNSQLTISKPGVYNIQFSAQLNKTGGGTSVVDIWLAKDGTPVDWTNMSIYVTSGNPKVAAWNFVENVTVANTYFEIMWSSADTLITLEASPANTSPTRPGIPSVIVSVTPVGA